MQKQEQPGQIYYLSEKNKRTRAPRINTEMSLPVPSEFANDAVHCNTPSLGDTAMTAPRKLTTTISSPPPKMMGEDIK